MRLDEGLGAVKGGLRELEEVRGDQRRLEGIRGGYRGLEEHQNGAPNCSSYHPNLPHIGFDGSWTNGIAVAAQNTPA